MLDETRPHLVIDCETDADNFRLTGRERHLIHNYRAMKAGAQEMLIDLSVQYMRTLPAVPVKLRLLPGK